MKSMRHISILFLALFAVYASAREVLPAEALTVAAEILDDGRPLSIVTLNQPDSRASSRYSAPYYIVASENGGFVIVSGNSKVKKVLGYSKEAKIDAENLPPQLEYMLDSFASQIEAITDSSQADPSWEVTFSEGSSGKILKTPDWGQDFPYNKDCPITDENKLSLTGCTATAMAIVMKYYNWPDKGEGSHSYHMSSIDIDTDVECDFNSMTFRWEDMPDVLTSSASDNHQSAIASLMKAAGTAINTHYGCGTSGALAQNIVGALREHFKYDYSCQYINKNNFSGEDYWNIIVGQIDAGRPVIMSGKYQVMNGHTWVVDGYDTDNGFLHFNWGWNGSANGFYSITAESDADPYPDERDIIINIFPRNDDKKYSASYVEFPTRMALSDVNNPGGLLFSSPVRSFEPFDVSVNSLIVPPRTHSELYLGLVDASGYIKELVDISGISNDNDEWISLTPFKSGCRFNMQFNESDSIRLFSIDDDSQIALPLTGTLDAPVCYSVGAVPLAGNIIDIQTDSNTQIKIGVTMHGLMEDYTLISGKGQFSVIPGLPIYFDISAVSPSEHHAVTLLQNDDYEVNINGSPLSIISSDSNNVVGWFIAKSTPTTLKVAYEPVSELSLTVDVPGTLESYIPVDAAKSISVLTVAGKLNASDIWYITRNFQSLVSLDIRKVTIVASTNDDVPNYDNIFVDPVQSDNNLPHVSFWGMRRLSNVLLPEGLTAIGDGAFISNNIKSIVIPEGVKTIGSWFLNDNPSFHSIYSRAVEPPAFTVYQNFEGSDCFENGTLYVPQGTAGNYQNSPVWEYFHNIVEVDFLSADASDFTSYVHIRDRNIVISELPGSNVAIYNINGTVVKHAVCGDRELSVKVSPGYYIVKTQTGVYKCIVK